MSLLKCYKTFLRIFFVIGLAPLTSENQLTEKRKITKENFKSILRRLVPLLNSLISLSQFSLSVKIVDGTLDGKIHTLLFFGYYTFTILSNIVGNIQCFFHQSVYLDIIRSIQRIEQIFMMKFSKKIDYHDSCTTLQWMTILLYCVLLSSTLSSYSANQWKVSLHTLLRTVVTILEIICTFCCLHPLLYVSIIRMFLIEMSNVLKTSRIFFQGTNIYLGMCEELKKLKLIHFEIYILVNKINFYFGWNLLFFLIKLFVHLTYNLYWIFIEIQELGWSSTHIGILDNL